MKEISVLGIDLAKAVFHLYGLDRQGKPALRRVLRRSAFKEFMVRLAPTRVVMEAGRGSNYWAREFSALGHEVKLITPQFVKPFVKSNKNDFNDAEAIVEASLRPTMRFVSVKTEESQDIQGTHRLRENLVRQKVSMINMLRGLLAEYGVVLSLNAQRKVLFEARLMIEKRSDWAKADFEMILESVHELEVKIERLDKKILELAKRNETSRRLMNIPGVGPLTATAFLTTANAISSFSNGREFSAWLGLVPKQNSSGGRVNLLGISKRGDKYLRKLLVHGSRAILIKAHLKVDRLHRWGTEKKEKRGANKAAIGLANKRARIIWAMMTRNEEYRAA